jgi:hypothetical protein
MKPLVQTADFQKKKRKEKVCYKYARVFPRIKKVGGIY